MDTINQSNVVLAEEISIKEMILKLAGVTRYLLSKWKTVVLFGIFGCIGGFLYAYLKKPIYTAECTFVLEDQLSGGGIGQYAGLASMVGIDLGSNGNNGIFQGDNIIELYKSRLMIEKTLLTKVEFSGKREMLIDRYIEFNKLRENWNRIPRLRDIRFDISTSQFKLQRDSVITSIVNDIKNNYLTVMRPDKKLGIISVKIKSKDESFAKVFTDKIVMNVNNFYVQTKTKKSLENLQILQKQTDSIRIVLNSAIAGAALASDANPNVNSAMQILRVPSQRRQIDVQATSAMYVEIVKNMEIAKISLRKETPLIQVLDEPVFPLKKDQMGRVGGAILGGAILGFLATLGLLLNMIFKKILR